MSLDSLANVKARLGISTSADDALLNLLRDSADAFIVEHCRRDFTAGPFTEYHPGNSVTVRLRNYPSVSVTSLKVDTLGSFGPETLLPSTSYIVDADRGIIYSRAGVPFALLLPAAEFLAPGTRAPVAVQVIYTASGTVPNDIKQAYAGLVAYWYRHVKTMIASQFQDVIQQTFGDTTSIFAKEQLAGLPIPQPALRLLAPYRDLLI